MLILKEEVKMKIESKYINLNSNMIILKVNLLLFHKVVSSKFKFQYANT